MSEVLTQERKLRNVQEELLSQLRIITGVCKYEICSSLFKRTVNIQMDAWKYI